MFTGRDNTINDVEFPHIRFYMFFYILNTLDNSLSMTFTQHLHEIHTVPLPVIKKLKIGDVFVKQPFNVSLPYRT